MKTAIKTFICCAALALLGAAADAGVMNPIPTDPITIDSGKLSGTLLASGVKAYLGVPFVAPPVGPLRWHAPMPVKPWNGIYNADTKPPECYFVLHPLNVNHYFGEHATSEDCLYTNIWVPKGARPGDKLPVVIWIHGGGFQEGSINFDVYGGEAMAKKGVIFMGIAYRVALFGYLAHPELTKESGHNASGNWGQLDQIAGLQWVKRNIAAFGGDPNNVTLVGQSAGAMSLNTLAVSPMARGLYNRMAALSGSYFGVSGPPTIAPMSKLEADGVRLQEALKVHSIAEMRLLPRDQIIAVAAANKIAFMGPTVDNYFLPEAPRQAYAEGKQIDLPLLLSSTGNDILSQNAVTNATTLADYKAGAATVFGADADKFLKLFPASTDEQALHQAHAVERIMGFGIVARDWAVAQSKTGKAPVWLTQFDRSHPYTPGITFADMNPKTAGAYHNSDLPFWFGTLDSLNLFRKTRDWTPYDYKLSNAMQDVLVAFARTGNPVTPEAPIPLYNPRHEQRLVFGNQAIRVETLNPKAIDFIEAHPQKFPF